MRFVIPLSWKLLAKIAPVSANSLFSNHFVDVEDGTRHGSKPVEWMHLIYPDVRGVPFPKLGASAADKIAKLMDSNSTFGAKVEIGYQINKQFPGFLVRPYSRCCFGGSLNIPAFKCDNETDNHNSRRRDRNRFTTLKLQTG